MNQDLPPVDMPGEDGIDLRRQIGPPDDIRSIPKGEVRRSHLRPLDRLVRQQMTDEVMYQLAALLPPAYRGLYSDQSKATQNYITFP